MSISWTQLYSETHQFSEGAIAIAPSFVGNILAVRVDTKPEYAETRQVIGYIFQDSGVARKGYALYSGNDILSLSLPETSGLVFYPTNFLSDSYTLDIAYTSVGDILEANTAPIPDDILSLVNRVASLEGLSTSPSWSDITDKPTSFNPDEHGHEIGDINGLAIRLDGIDSSLTGKASSGDITVLDGRIDTLESASYSAGSWTDLTDKPSTFAPSTHTHVISDITGLATALGDKASSSSVSTLAGRVTSLESATPSGSSSSNLQTVGVNATLESGKSYLATTSGLTLTLPSSPAAGDSINITTGNFDLRVNQNTSQAIRNLSTDTPSGSDTGLILKPYGSVQVTWLGSGLWVTGNRARTVNNWVPLVTEGSASLKTYTPVIRAGGVAAFGGNITNIRNGIKAPTGDHVSNGVLINTPTSTVLCTAAADFLLDTFDFWNGQGNLSLGVATSGGYGCSEIKVYRGDTTDSSALIGTFNPVAINGTRQIFTVSHAIRSSMFTFWFSNPGSAIGVLELELFGRTVTGGETVAT